MATDVEIKIKAKNEASAEIKQVKGDLSGLKNAFAGGIAGGVIGALGLSAVDSAIGQVSQLASEIGKMALEAGEVGELRDAFDELTAGIGQSSNAMLAASRLGSRGLIADYDLLQASNKALMLGVIQNTDQMASAWALAEKNADALGIGITDAFNSIVQGVNTQRERTLAAAGVVVDADRAMQEYAASLGMTADMLDNAQRKQALLNAVLAQAPTAGQGVDSINDAVQRLDTAVKNLRVSLGETFGPGMTLLAQGLADAINQLQEREVAAKNELAQNKLFEVGPEITAGMDAYNAAKRDYIKALQEADANSLDFENTFVIANKAWDDLKTKADEYNAAAATTGAPQIDIELLKQGEIGFAGAAQGAKDLAAGATAAGGPVAAIQAQLAALAGQADVTEAALRGMWTSAAGALGAGVAFAEYKKDVGELSSLQQGWYYMGEAGEFARQEYLQKTNEKIQDQVKATLDLTKVTQGHSAAVRETNQAYDSLLSTAQSVVQNAMNLGGIKWPGMDSGSGEDPNGVAKNARRMAAIANEGLVNQPWLEDFKNTAPAAYADLMIKIAEGMDAQSAAQSIMKDFQNGLRPDLLDEGTIKQQIKDKILGQSATADYAKSLANDIASELGISLPEALAATQQALGVPSTAKPGEAGTNTTDLTGQGNSAGASFVAGFQATASGASIVLAIVGQMTAAATQFDSSGRSSGKAWGSGFLATVGDNVPPALISLLVTLVTPGVVSNINNQNSQNNPPDSGNNGVLP